MIRNDPLDVLRLLNHVFEKVNGDHGEKKFYSIFEEN
jgi:hypothetical protein